MSPEERANAVCIEWEKNGNVTMLALITGAIREAVAAERERCKSQVQKVVSSLRMSSQDYASEGNHGESLRRLVECDGALLALTAVAREGTS